MRISQLSQISGTPIATIKFYIRERLLPRGRPTAANQADYGEEHVERLRLIRALRAVADLPVATVGEVVAALEQPEAAARAEHVTTALKALAPAPGPTTETSRAIVADLVERMGWSVDEDSAGYHRLESALAALEDHWDGTITMDALEEYARVAARLAQNEIPDDWDPGGSGSEALTYAVLGTVLFEPVILALRRLAHADRHRRLMEERS